MLRQRRRRRLKRFMTSRFPTRLVHKQRNSRSSCCHQRRSLANDRVEVLPTLIAWLLGSEREKQGRSEEHTSELQSLMRTSYAFFWWKKKKTTYAHTLQTHI